MAGAGYKTFTAAMLSATDVNTYLMQQAVMVFDSAAARTAAIAVPTEGMVSYLKDLNRVQFYDGTQWISVGSGGSGTYTIMEVGP